jgi:hypothetical protein
MMMMQVHVEERGKCEVQYIIAFTVLRGGWNYVLMFVRNASVYLLDRLAVRDEFYEMEYVKLPNIIPDCHSHTLYTLLVHRTIPVYWEFPVRWEFLVHGDVHVYNC